MIAIFKQIFYIPLYNILILILNIKWVDIGIATIILTALVKVILYPVSKKTTITQIKMREKAPELEAIKQKYKDKQEQALKTMEFYRVNQINPLSGFFALFIQIPIVFSLYYMFFRSGLPVVDTGLLYSFVKIPSHVSMLFLGFWDISQKSILLAILAAVSTFLQIHFSPISNNGPKNSDDFSAIMAKQMKYTMPLVILFVAWRLSGVVALYWFVSNVLGMVQDFYLKKLVSNKTESLTV